MKKVMILGAGSGQVPFIEKCKKRGAEVLVVGPRGDYPGFDYADKKFYYDTRNREEIYSIAAEESVDAITTDQTDVAVPTVAYVSEKLGLASIGYERALIFTNKYIMRCKAKELGIAVPAFAEVSSEEEAVWAAHDMHFPLIIKPTDSSGSRGVYRVDSIEELKTKVSQSVGFSLNKKAIVEEFINGREYGVDGLALCGKYRNLDLSIKEHFDLPNLCIPKMLMFTSADMISDKIEKMVLNTNKKLVDGIGLPFGITHASYIYCEEDRQVYLVEIAARGGGDYISSDLTPLACGINTNSIILDYLLDGKTVDITKLSLQNNVSAYRCFELSKGKVIEIENAEKIKDIPGVYRSCLDNLYVGKEIEELIDNTKKQGPILIYGKTREECFKTIEIVEKTLKIETQYEKHVNGIKW